MLKKIIAVALVVLMLFAVVGCGRTKILHCDHCNTEVEVKENSQMNEDWSIYCEKCNVELFGDDPVIGTGTAEE